MNKIEWLINPVILLFVLLVSINTACAPNDHPTAPDFTLLDLNGNRISLSDYEGKVLFLNIWATWCAPCRAEIPDFIDVYRDYKDKGLEIIGVSVDTVSPNRVRQFVEMNGMNYPVVMFNREFLRDYQPGQAIPTTIIIDRKGRLRHKQIGLMSKKMVLYFFEQFS
jgi:peroxiredoxin